MNIPFIIILILGTTNSAHLGHKAHGTGHPDYKYSVANNGYKIVYEKPFGSIYEIDDDKKSVLMKLKYKMEEVENRIAKQREKVAQLREYKANDSLIEDNEEILNKMKEQP